MINALTKESDDDEDLALPTLPAGARNYMTPAGYARTRTELLALIDDERSKVVEIVHWAASDVPLAMGIDRKTATTSMAKNAC